jgi:sterol 24-C-methyltransferase
MREIARFSGAEITGINNNEYQLEKCDGYNQKAGLAGQCKTLKSDFMNIAADDATFDAAYAIEATVHAPDTAGVYSEIARILKPGGLFAAYEWCMTGLYDPDNSEHKKIKDDIERGNALPDMDTTASALRALEKAGFEILRSNDMALEPDVKYPWYRALQGKDIGLKSFPRTAIGRVVTHFTVKVLEKAGFAPKGTTEVSEFLVTGADALVEGGKAGVFTPMFFFVARKK